MQQTTLTDAVIGDYAVRRLTLTNFRNYKKLRLETPKGLLVFTGANGVGKTNLLEAISLLVPGRGLRSSKLTDFAYKEGDKSSGNWAIAAKIDTPKGFYDVGTGFNFNSDNGSNTVKRRIVKVNGDIVRNQTFLSDVLSAYWLTPQMDRLFQDGPSSRRRFLDRMVFGWDPAHAGRLSSYEHAMRQRMKLLHDSHAVDNIWLGSLEEIMATKGVAIAVARLDMAARLAVAAKSGWGPFPGAYVGIQGDLETWLEEGPALAAEDKFRASLIAGRDDDARSGRTGVGPQQSNLIVRHLVKNQDAVLCSTGEQKALLITLILANARTRAVEEGVIPILLLDEITAHLDAERRDTLFELLIDLGGQVWLTGTEKNLFKHLRNKACFFNIFDSNVEHLS